MDSISDTGGADTVQFGAGITRQNILAISDSSGVHIRLFDSQGPDMGRGLDMNLAPDCSPTVETIRFADGTTAKVADFFYNVVCGTDGFNIIFTGATDDLIYARGGCDIVYSDGGNDIIYGGEGSDLLAGDGGDDTIFGENGSDIIFGGSGNDLLDGGACSDLLHGGSGDDTYVVDNSSDLIMESAKDGTDTVQSSVSYDLRPNVENLTLTGSAPINGDGNSLDNVLIGNSSNNNLSGGSGNDTLIGGAGADTLEGGKGDDTYRFGRGDGADVISDYDKTRGNTDTMLFGAGISSDQLWLSRSGKDLQISIIGTSDKATISDWYRGSAYQVEQFKTSDGQALLNNQVDALVSAMAAFAPPAPGQTTLPDYYQNILNPVIAANWR